MKKRITLSVNEAALRAARTYAAEHGTSVNALVREFLDGLVRARTERAKVGEELAKLAEQSRGRLGPDWKWNREDIYRERLSRYERKP